VELRFGRAVELKEALDRVRALSPRVEAVADRLLVYTDNGDHTANLIASGGVEAASVLVRRASLEDVFLILTGRTLED
jgi:lipooligosaccharide transport system ATP-binding protein